MESLLHLGDAGYLYFHFHDLSYEHFIGFVKKYVAHQTEEPFVEEPYYKIMWDAGWEKQYVECEIARGHSKSEFAVWKALYFLIVQPVNPFFLAERGIEKPLKEGILFSSDNNTVVLLADRLKRYLAGDDILKKFLPEGNDTGKNNNDQLELKNGSRLLIRSIKTKRGPHPDWIIIDDPTTESSTLSDSETMDYLTGAIMPMTASHSAPLWLQGTPIRQSDVMSRIKHEDNGLWHHVFLPAYDRETNIVLSPQRFSIQKLQQLKKLQGSRKFEAEYLLNPIDDESSIIKGVWFDSCRNKDFSCRFNRFTCTETFLGWDFAFSDKDSADLAVGVSVGRLNNQLVLLNIVTFKGLSALEQMEKIKELHAVYKYDYIGLEENSIQSLVKEIRSITMPDGRGLPLKLFRLSARDDRDTVPLLNNGVVNLGKQNFILRLATLFENNEIVLPDSNDYDRGVVDALRAECVSWSLELSNSKESRVGTLQQTVIVERGPHPDRPVALGYAVEVSRLNRFVWRI